jgi:hypothetical protein
VETDETNLTDSAKDNSLTRSEIGYLVQCARADFFGEPRPSVFSKIKKRLSHSELENFLRSIEERDEYRSYLSKLDLDEAAQKSRNEMQRRLPIIDKIPEMPMRRILSLWENAISTLVDPKRKTFRYQARQVIEAINSEWNKRRDAIVHPDDFFEWPTTEAEIGDGAISTSGWLENGMFRYLGYRVGQIYGKNDRVRKEILREIFMGTLPSVFPREYMDQWGEAGSSKRLHKMAECIVAFARSAKRRRDSKMEVAVGQWENDLEHLYYEYYVGKFHFAWPSANV